MFKFKKIRQKLAFSLAEMIITLGIIGIIVAITLPSLVVKHKKDITMTKLRFAYSVVSQAIKLSEADNSYANTWEYGTDTSGTATLSWFNVYLKPYMKYTSAGIDPNDSDQVLVKLDDGIQLIFKRDVNMVILALLNGSKSYFPGKDVFYFEMVPGADRKSFRPFEEGATGTGQAKWTNGPGACSASGTKEYCAGLIIYDGWEFSNAYPW